MPINLVVRAQVINIRVDRPKSVDRFLVDSNVWLNTLYTRFSSNFSRYQTKIYPNYIRDVRMATAKLYRCELSFSEIGAIIEKTEYSIFEVANPNITFKEFRHNYPAERQTVIAEIENVWNNICAFSETMPVNVDSATIQEVLIELKTLNLDTYDSIFIKTAKSVGITQILTDDSDYATVTGIVVYTANNTIINAASAQGRLIAR